jgi:hypothetical protein
MTGPLLQHVRGLAAAIATTGGFAITATLTTPDNATSLAVTGLGTGTWMVFEDMRQQKPVNSKSNSFDIPISQLIAANYPYGNLQGEPDLRKHKVIVTDDGGLQGTFTIVEDHYNATFGLFVVILGKSA